ncbi:hypothetical protein [Agrobacterium tumefaciens]|uniref:hypothetical protein n=1 Tax=Agrobacterium tumefaciens TaxID=358 RepID=UPI0021D35389|nr:hypothetical protein [Agrobacterium tumefaciens]UXS00084.1 hypothetical protein FY156_00550 [Agrobacterium tumefaciens]
MAADQLVQAAVSPVGVPAEQVRSARGASLETFKHRAPSRCGHDYEALLEAPSSAGAVELCLLIAALEQEARAHLAMGTLNLRSACQRPFEVAFMDVPHWLPADGCRLHGPVLHAGGLEFVAKRRQFPGNALEGAHLRFKAYGARYRTQRGTLWKHLSKATFWGIRETICLVEVGSNVPSTIHPMSPPISNTRSMRCGWHTAVLATVLIFALFPSATRKAKKPYEWNHKALFMTYSPAKITFLNRACFEVRCAMLAKRYVLSALYKNCKQTDNALNNFNQRISIQSKIN